MIENISNQKLSITPSSVDDIPALELLVNSAYRGESSKKGWTTEADLLDGIRTDKESLHEMIDKEGAILFKCTDDKNEIVGCVYLEKQDDSMYLGMLTVLPQLQDKGIGKMMMKASEKHALKNNCTKMKITVITNRKELIGWYQRNGYKATGAKKPFPSDPKFGIPKQPLEFMVMEKQLTNEYK